VIARGLVSLGRSHHPPSNFERKRVNTIASIPINLSSATASTLICAAETRKAGVGKSSRAHFPMTNHKLETRYATKHAKTLVKNGFHAFGPP